MNIKHVKSFKWGLVNVLINFIKQLLLVPFFLSALGKEGYSLWIICASVIFLIRTINLGQLNYSSNLINIQSFKNKPINHIISNALSANIFLIIFQILVGVILCYPPIFSKLTGFDIEYLIKINFSTFFSFLLLSRLINQFFSLFYLRLLEPLNLINLRIKYDGLRELFEIIVIVSILLLTKNFSFLGLGIFMYNVFFSIFIYNNLKSHTNKFFKRLHINFRSGVRIIVNSLYLFLNFLIEKFYENGINIFITILYSPLLVPVFTTTRTVANLSMRFALIISEPMMLDLQKGFSANDKESVFRNFKYYWKITFSFILIIYSAIAAPIEYLFNFWTKNKLEFNNKLFIWLFLSVFYLNFSVVITQYYRRTNKVDYLTRYNLLKTGSLILFLFVSNFYKKLELAGFALFMSEFISSIFIVITLINQDFKIFLKYVLKDYLLIFLLTILSIIYLCLENLFVYNLGLITIIIIYNYDILSNKIFNFYKK